ncbi:hypothetical protein An07g07750 [Aspergillus niger]|uniref:Uncharacterized protein n=2 Tax=Aspergillus niger TaxID=5061 RepID=A5AAX6_ASPNC|nr:hypothetical protein An07g07750 [Aspergillus niger]CAK39591.1 hypothetical protein An07g07750 [Aspergillus niger]
MQYARSIVEFLLPSFPFPLCLTSMRLLRSRLVGKKIGFAYLIIRLRVCFTLGGGGVRGAKQSSVTELNLIMDKVGYMTRAKRDT